jgi:hypothetical protein
MVVIPKGAIVGMLVGGGAAGVAGYFIGKHEGAEDAFTSMGIPNDTASLLAILTGDGYTATMLAQLATASVRELQCLVAAHLVGSKYGMTQV